MTLHYLFYKLHYHYLKLFIKYLNIISKSYKNYDKHK